jgi:hypothetical protein
MENSYILTEYRQLVNSYWIWKTLEFLLRMGNSWVFTAYGKFVNSYWIWKLHELLTCICDAIESLSVKISDIFFVPKTFLRVVAASSLVEESAFSTLHTDIVGSKILLYITASTATVTESLVKIYRKFRLYKSLLPSMLILSKNIK